MKADTVDERNKKIEEYSPEEYNHIYHLKNLKNIEHDGKKAETLVISSNPPFEMTDEYGH